MVGLLTKKYYVAVLDNDANGFVDKIVGTLKTWYNNKVVIKTFQDTHSLFEAVNLSKAKNKPFDFAVLGSTQVAEQIVLQKVNPDLKIIVCSDEHTFKVESSKVMV